MADSEEEQNKEEAPEMPPPSVEQGQAIVIESLQKEKEEMEKKIDSLTGMSYVMAEQLENVGYDMTVRGNEIVTRGIEVQNMAKQILARARLTPTQQELVNKSKEQINPSQSQ